jgi:hypothetical protein
MLGCPANDDDDDDDKFSATACTTVGDMSQTSQILQANFSHLVA